MARRSWPKRGRTLKIGDADFRNGFQHLVREHLGKSLVDGCFNGASVIIEKTLTEPPTVPKDLGTLRASGSIIINNELMGTTATHMASTAPISVQHGEWTSADRDPPSPATEHDSVIKDDEIVTVMGYNRPWAAWLHENPMLRFTTMGSGAKFLEAHLSQANAKVIGAPTGRLLSGSFSFREQLYRAAKFLGDVNAVLRGKIGQRVGRRIAGKIVARHLAIFPRLGITEAAGIGAFSSAAIQGKMRINPMTKGKFTVRGGLLTTARLMADANAIARGKIGERAARRGAGKMASRGTGKFF